MLPILRMGGQIFSGRAESRRREHEIKAQGHAKDIGIQVFKNAVIQARREEQKQPCPWADRPLTLIARVNRVDRTSMADRKTWHQFVELLGVVQTEVTCCSAAIAGQVKHGAEMGIRMMVPAHNPQPAHTRSGQASSAADADQSRCRQTRWRPGTPRPSRQPDPIEPGNHHGDGAARCH